MAQPVRAAHRRANGDVLAAVAVTRTALADVGNALVRTGLSPAARRRPRLSPAARLSAGSTRARAARRASVAGTGACRAAAGRAAGDASTTDTTAPWRACVSCACFPPAHSSFATSDRAAFSARAHSAFSGGTFATLVRAARAARAPTAGARAAGGFRAGIAARRPARSAPPARRRVGSAGRRRFAAVLVGGSTVGADALKRRQRADEAERCGKTLPEFSCVRRHRT
jgi:hypothetical protein